MKNIVKEIPKTRTFKLCAFAPEKICPRQGEMSQTCGTFIPESSLKRLVRSVNGRPTDEGPFHGNYAGCRYAAVAITEQLSSNNRPPTFELRSFGPDTLAAQEGLVPVDSTARRYTTGIRRGEQFRGVLSPDEIKKDFT